ncbi:MAG: DUF6538 domain-containing protein, partial [Burkholderiaceae bacterium]
MTCHLPYLQRRGDRFFFRIQVPLALREVIGQRELTKALKTSDRVRAVPMALTLGAISKRLFDDLQTPGMTKPEILALLRAAKNKLEMDDLKQLHADEILS